MTTLLHESPDKDFSPFERLPPELFSSIIEYVPESVARLRRVSKELKSKVEDFATSKTIIRLVEILHIGETNNTYSRDREKVKIELTISKRLAPLFQMRYRLLRNLVGIKTDQMNHISNVLYRKFEWDSRYISDDMLEHICSLTGKRVKQISIDDEDFYSEDRNTHIEKFLTNLQFEQLKISVDILRDIGITFVKTIINKHNIEHLFMNISEVESKQDAEQILIDLSSLLRTLHIYQPFVEGIERGSHYLFGLFNADWDDIIVKMFSQKLDRLDIENDGYRRYLPAESRNALRRQLPIMEKNIWFRAYIRSEANQRNERNGFLIEVGPEDYLEEEELRIRHTSRLNEPNDLFFFDKDGEFEKSWK